MATKICTCCGLELPEENFFFKNKAKGKRNAQCKDCYKRKRKETYPDYYQAKRDEYLARARNRRLQNPNGRRAEYLSKYGLTVEDYEKMFSAQNGQCAICGNASPDKVLNVDHDHKTGKVRALLCNGCNTALGHIRENPGIAQSIIHYLMAHKNLEDVS